MQKIEVDVTPVRIVSVGTARPQNEFGLTPLTFQVTIPKVTPLSDEQEYVLPKTIDFNVPSEYVGYNIVVMGSNEFDKLGETYSMQLPFFQLSELLEIVSEQDYVHKQTLLLLPPFDETLNVTKTHELDTRDYYGVPVFNNVPKLFVSKNGKLTTIMDDQTTDDYARASQVQQLMDRMTIEYKGVTLTNYVSHYSNGDNYQIGFEIELPDGSKVESNISDRLAFWEIKDFQVDYNNLPRSISVLFKHNNRSFTAELWNSGSQP